MDAISIAVTGVTGLAVTIAASEINASSAKWAEKLLGYATKITPSADRGRRGEEWAAHLNDVPGPVSKLLCAFGFVKTAYATLLEPALPALGRLLFLAAKHPKVAWRIYTGCRNWRVVAAKGRELGWNIPKGPLDLKWAELRECTKQPDDPRWREYDATTYAERLSALEAKDKLLLGVIAVCAARMKPSEIIPNSAPVWDEITDKISARCFPDHKRARRRRGLPPPQ